MRWSSVVVGALMCVWVIFVRGLFVWVGQMFRYTFVRVPTVGLGASDKWMMLRGHHPRMVTIIHL